MKILLKGLSLVFLLQGYLGAAQQKSLTSTKRTIRHEIPLTNSIQKAIKAGTRDFTGTPGKNYWQLEADYDINVSLNPRTQVLSGTETILMHNNSTDDLNSIVLRLDHNIFRADVPRGSSVPAETTEGMVITRLVVDGVEVDLHARPAGFRRGQKSTPKISVSGLQQTVAVINLATPIKAKSKATVEISWNTKLPGGENGRGHRMTQRWGSRVFQPTQWFPRLAKYDDLRGWQRDVYLGPAEFFNNFGTFDVKINVPDGWIVSSTGVLQNANEILTQETNNRLAKVLKSNEELTIIGQGEKGLKPAKDNQIIWHYKADKVNDFAWAASNEFVWKATRAVIPSKGPIPIHMVFLPERANRFTRAGAVTRHALEFYSNLWTPYAFPQLTLQDGPSAGMEYPMVINSNQGAADHETAHQWWPMVVGTNETRYGWMDEGFNTYMNILSNADATGRPAKLDGWGQNYGRISGNEEEPTMMWMSNYGGNLYGFQTYNKAPMMLSMLGSIVGDDAVQAAMKKYAAAWSFKHPSPWDFVYFMSSELRMDLGWFWYYWLWTTESVDGSINKVSKSGSTTTVDVYQAGAMPSPVVLKVEFEEGRSAIKKMKNAKMLDANTAIVTWPVSVWFNGNRTFKAKLQFGSRKIKKITFDPFGRFPDSDVTDNVWPKK
ncbi:peptidase [Polaribacter pacificus]|uniref:Peptidase n=1 Tax=Polaribacter pacificus TaxID=1775173 RepID=A0A917ME88_9FLAO|nr:M1 family metallopeptidase [Polaribacter pacificus]GGG98101.1 peptidase [Polaribacter pacificus]